MHIFILLLQMLSCFFLFKLFNSDEFDSLDINPILESVIFGVLLIVFFEFKVIMLIFVVWYILSRIFLSIWGNK